MVAAITKIIKSNIKMHYREITQKITQKEVMRLEFKFSSVLILNSMLCVIAVSSLKLLTIEDRIKNKKDAASFITQHIILQLIFVSSLLITGGDYRYFKVKEPSIVYGISIINGIIGKFIFRGFINTNKKINLFNFFVKLFINSAPFLSPETKASAIKDIEEKKEKKRRNYE